MERVIKSKVTSIDVARMLGVSQSTVSRAFSPTASISEKKRKMVKDAAARLGYTPNAIARSLISNRSGLVAIVLDSANNPMYDLQTRKLALEVQRKGGQVLLCPIDEDDLDLAISRAIEYQVDGLIIATSRLSSRVFSQCENFGVHLSLINRYIDGTKANSIGIDNIDAGVQAATYLLNKKFTKFTYVSGDAGSMTNEDRWKGFSQKINELGLEKPVYIHAKYDFDSGFLAAQEVLKKVGAIETQKEAIFCAGDIIALGLIDGLRQGGARVPEDFAVIAVDDIPMSAWPSYNLTTIRQPQERMAKIAVDDLLGRINKDEITEGRYLLEKGVLIERGSTDI